MEFIEYQTIWNTILTFFLFTCGILLLYISIQGIKYKNTYGAISTLLTCIILFFFAMASSVFGILPWPYNGFFTYWMVPIISLYLLFWFIVKYKELKNQNKSNDSKEESDLPDPFADRNLYQKEISLKMEFYRKAFHLAGFLILLSYYVVTPLINNAVIRYITTNGQAHYEQQWGPVASYPFSMNDPQAAASITFFALMCTLTFVIIPEFIRVLAGARYSLYNRITKAVLRGKEYKSVGPQVFLIVGSTFAFYLAEIGLVDYSIVLASIIIACLSDAIAAVIGRKYGKHKVKTLDKSIKSVEGFLGGALSSVCFGMIFLGPIYGIIAGILFFALDYITIPIADNLLNPIILTIALTLCVNLLNLPVGW